jgi:murein DD-endopeptidase MepM/ murein hydrolase activator NlpD
MLWVLAALVVQDITWQPATPRQGSLIVISEADAITGQVAGEPLHFRDGKALAAVPLTTNDSIHVQTLLIRWDGAVIGHRATVPVAVRKVPVDEQVRAAERFTAPPDSALQARIDRERVLSREASLRAHKVPRLWRQPFIRPRTARITSVFGSGRQVNGVWRSRHYGLDIAGPKGAPVRVSNRGVVALVGNFFYGGNSIFVHHGDGIMTVYHHLSRVLVAVGDTVERGQLIGKVGATGRVTGPHLHWGAQYGTISFDPTELLKLP